MDRHFSVRRFVRSFGYDIVRSRSRHPQIDIDGIPPDISIDDRETWEMVREYTMTSPERVSSLCAAVRYVINNNISGAIVECGVWKGGSMMAAARTLMNHSILDRDLFLFDTFTQMPPPNKNDIDFMGRSADTLMAGAKSNSWLWARNSFQATRSNLLSVGYPEQRIHLVQGLVEETIPHQAPSDIAILRLDTDWYSSTKHELEHLFPRVAPYGVIIIDDYGHWLGAKRAVDEYFENHRIQPLLHRIDYTGRIAIKLPNSKDSAQFLPS
ncbi:TylF/MycF/NovP-related O-methyltransferase [Rudaeicoccus suwonensis]|uniref:Macrocin-O-methyltransferase TylF n=1 Tax=Rudaeicoccus suwonensis TaxID=657409 RepID=A0A561DVM6_9MICO|nr:TylF/MycF/NovP-related O-methyltransferase [Rudaeicoccus suwonensis]TWE07415.1 macrocin-O-methyltransferase TylF [Rudaeicoccus suwonensis]